MAVRVVNVVGGLLGATLLVWVAAHMLGIVGAA